MDGGLDFVDPGAAMEVLMQHLRRMMVVALSVVLSIAALTLVITLADRTFRPRP